MKSMRPNSAAIFFMTYFYRAGGGHGPIGPPLDTLLELGTDLGGKQAVFRTELNVTWCKGCQVNTYKDNKGSFTSAIS